MSGSVNVSPLEFRLQNCCAETITQLFLFQIYCSFNYTKEEKKKAKSNLSQMSRKMDGFPIFSS